MTRFTFEQPIRQLEKRKGGYFYLTLGGDIVKQYPKGAKTRLQCVLDEKLSFPCGLNHSGDGNFFIIVATRKLKTIGKTEGDTVRFEIFENPDPLGVEVPEVLSVLLEQDENARAVYEKLTDGKKRTLIFSIRGVKNIDRQVEKIMEFLNGQKR